jgi:hypothetical protein
MVEAVNARRVLVALSAAQLVAGTAGHVLALKRGLAFNIAFIGWRGRPDRVARDSWLLGTGISAPVLLLAIQSAATARLAVGANAAAARFLGALGAAMIGGYLIEHETRTALAPGGADGIVTPVVAAGLGLCVPMAGLGLSGRADR